MSVANPVPLREPDEPQYVTIQLRQEKSSPFGLSELEEAGGVYGAEFADVPSA